MVILNVIKCLLPLRQNRFSHLIHFEMVLRRRRRNNGWRSAGNRPRWRWYPQVEKNITFHRLMENIEFLAGIIFILHASPCSVLRKRSHSPSLIIIIINLYTINHRNVSNNRKQRQQQQQPIEMCCFLGKDNEHLEMRNAHLVFDVCTLYCVLSSLRKTLFKSNRSIQSVTFEHFFYLCSVYLWPPCFDVITIWALDKKTRDFSESAASFWKRERAENHVLHSENGVGVKKAPRKYLAYS